MNIKDIQSRLDELRKAATAKGLREARTEYDIRSDQAPRIYLWWKTASQSALDGLASFDTLEKMAAHIAALPTPDEMRRNEFMAALGNVIDLGRENHIEVDFLNPLVATMKRLSENAITDQRRAS